MLDRGSLWPGAAPTSLRAEGRLDDGRVIVPSSASAFLPSVSSVPLHSSFSPTLAEPFTPLSLFTHGLLLSIGFLTRFLGGNAAESFGAPSQRRGPLARVLLHTESNRSPPAFHPQKSPLHAWIQSEAHHPKPQLQLTVSARRGQTQRLLPRRRQRDTGWHQLLHLSVVLVRLC